MDYLEFIARVSSYTPDKGQVSLEVYLIAICLLFLANCLSFLAFDLPDFRVIYSFIDVRGRNPPKFELN